jgi:tRNA nucleotidyltransferase/poly(A) polymerase
MIQFENAVKFFGSVILSEFKEANIICWIAGGAVRDYFLSLPINSDIDIFFPNKKEWDAAVFYLKISGAEVLFESENATKFKYKDREFDLVKKYFYQTPQSTIDDFDFTVSMLAVDFENVYHAETTFIDLAKKQLMLHQLQFPANTMRRAFRYYTKGFKMCRGEMEKLLKAIQEMPKPETPAETNNEGLGSTKNSKVFIGID